MLVVWGMAGAVQFLANPVQNFFIEQDPSLSYPLMTGPNEEIPDWLVILLAIPLSMLCVAFIQILFYYIIKEHAIPPKALNFFLPQLAFLEAMGLDVFITAFLKNFAGRKRPNFLAYCNYQGYRTALSSNNFTEYFSLTKFGTIGDISKCWDKSRLNDAQYSFPSGHSSTIFCGLGYASIFVIFLLNHYTKNHNMLKTIIGFVLFISAATIAATRPRDHWHNYDDVLAGCAIGMACATFAFSVNFGGEIKEEDEIINLQEQPLKI